jgi:hypothetical protein
MADYKETDIVGKAWNRCHKITIQNVRNVLPFVNFSEERVFSLDDNQEIRQNLGDLVVEFAPNKEIILLNAETGEPTGKTATYNDAYMLLYSAYIAAAKERDANIVEPTQEIDLE